MQVKFKIVQISILPVLLALCLPSLGQPASQPLKIIITPDHPSWEYNIGVLPVFKISVLQNNIPLKGITVNYEIGAEKMKTSKSGSLLLKEGENVISSDAMKNPGFLRCKVSVEWNKKKYQESVTVGYQPDQIVPTVQKPADFNAFWQKAKAELALVPLDVKMTLLTDKSTPKTQVYHVSINHSGQSKIYGILCVPKKAGKYPAILQVPGAGIRPYQPDLELAEKGLIVFTMGIHGIPVNMDPGVYKDLESGALKGYFFFNADHKDRYYYKRVYLGCIRAVDFIHTLPEFDGTNLAVSGNSQGGALSIVTAALDSRVKFLAAIHPALCDLTGYLKQRAGGWPHFFNESNAPVFNSKNVLETLSYYDVVNFAGELNVSGFYTWGYNDETCPPTSMFAAYNNIKAPKVLELFKDTGHWFYPEQKEAMNTWLIKKLMSSE